VNEKTFEDALRRDVMDRSAMGTANKTVSVTEVNNQLLAIRTASKINVAELPKEQFNATLHFSAILEDLRSQKCRTPFEVIKKALATLGYTT
jgi:hypothetical protein